MSDRRPTTGKTDGRGAGNEDFVGDLLYFQLPWPPSVNAMYCNYRGGRHASKRLKEFKQLAAIKLANSRLNINEPCKIVLKLYPPLRGSKKRDPSNFVKAIEDALVDNEILVDDVFSHPIPLIQDRVKEGYCEVFIKKMRDFERCLEFDKILLNELFNF